MQLPRCNRLHAIACAATALAGAFVLACAVGAGVADVDGGTDDGDAGSGGNTRDAHRGASFDQDSGAPAHPDESPDAGPPHGDAGGGDSGAHDAGSNPASCAVPNTCATAINMGVVSGDTGAETQNTNGITAKWLSVRVGENDNSPIGRKLSLKVDLVSPPGVNFDLYVYVNEGTDVLECMTPTGSSTSSTVATDSVSIKWGEGAVANGKDDSRTVSIEVRYVSGTCDPNAKWTLNVKGN